MLNGEMSGPDRTRILGANVALNEVARAALKELGQIVVDGCLPALRKQTGLTIDLGEGEFVDTDDWVGPGPQLVGQCRVDLPVSGRLVLAMPMQLLQRSQSIYEDLLESVGGAASGLSPLETLSPPTTTILTELLKSIMFSLGNVCGDDFEWSQGRAGMVLGPDSLGMYDAPMVMNFSAVVGSSAMSSAFSLSLDTSLAASLAELVLENDGLHENGNVAHRMPVAQREKVTYRKAFFQELNDNPITHERNHLNLLMDVPLEVTVELGRTRKQVREVLELGPGSVVELDKLAGEPVDVHINGRLIARGEVVVVEDNFGVRLTDIVSPSDRVGPLG